MTSSDLAPSSLRETGSRTVEGASVVACGFCLRRLSDEFFFTCRLCDASYCYIHMSRHPLTACARQVRKNERVAAIEEGGVPLSWVGSLSIRASSANV
jgi:hypothetical protein